MRQCIRSCRNAGVTALAVACGVWWFSVGSVASAAEYLAENVHDTSVHADEALVNVGVRMNRWPDCTTLKSATEDIFRLEGVSDGAGQEKAFAFWKWFRILVSSTGGGYAYEGPKEKPALVRDGHKIFAVYGHHQCDGLSWGMVSLWRGAGLMALDECTLGHTTAALRYRDADGRMRYHTFDPQGRFYYWDAERQRVGVRSIPVMTGMVYRHVMQPQRVHSLRTSLRWGETIERKWDNEGHVVPSGRPGSRTWRSSYYVYEPGKTRGIYASVGEEVQRFEVDTTPERFQMGLYDGSSNVACSPGASGSAALHPKVAGEVATFIYRLAPPYVAVDGLIEATLLKGDASDLCRLSLSTDGTTWTTLIDKTAVGEEAVKIDVGRGAREKGEPDIYTAYNIFIKAEFMAVKDVHKTGLNGLKMTVWRQCNKRTLPNLRPGDNYVKVTADRMAPRVALEVDVRYRLKDEPHKVVRTIRSFPYYFKIAAPGARTVVPRNSNYDQVFNVGDLRMESIRMRLVDAQAAGPDAGSMDPAKAEVFFTQAYPHPASLTHRAHQKIVKDRRRETDIIQTTGFFPQSRVRLDDKEKVSALVEGLNSGSVYRTWRSAQELGDYPAAVDTLCEALPKANIDLTLFIVKALAQIGDKKAIPALLAKWRRQGSRGAPGTRYIPDALAAIGDPSVVPDLVKPLQTMRFDFRFHIAHALGILGGPLAEKTLADLAENDPFPPVRDEAKKGLERLRNTGR